MAKRKPDQTPKRRAPRRGCPVATGPLGCVDLRALLEASTDQAVLLDAQGLVLACNAAAERAGVRAAALGSEVFGLLSPEAAATCRRKFGQVLRSGRPARFSERRRGRFLDHVLYSIAAPDSGEARLLLLTRDETRSRRVLDRLAESEQRFRTIADFTYDWEYWIGPDGRLLYMSPSCERITGYPFQAFLEDKGLLLAIIHADDRAQALEHGRGNGVFHSEFRILTRQGEPRWISHFSQPVYGPDGAFLGRRASNRDITDRKRAELELRKTTEQLSVIVGHLPLIPYTCEVEGEFATTFIGPSVKAVTGYDPERFLADPKFWFARLHPKDRARVVAELARLKVEKRIEYEYRWRVADGSYRWFADSMRLVEPSGEAYIVGVFTDVTGRKNAEQALREASKDLERRVHARTRELEAVNRRLREEIRQRGRAEEALFQSRREFKALADNSPDLIARLDERMRFLYANPALARVAHLETGDSEGRIDGEFGQPEPLPGPLAETWEPVCRKVLADGRQRGLEFSLPQPAGRRHFLCHVVPERDPAGEVRTVMIVALDITEHKLLEDQLRHLPARILAAQEAERKRIGRELHDSIGQALGGIKLLLESEVRKLAGAIAPEHIARLSRIVPLTQEAITEVQRIVMDLRPTILDDLGFSVAVGWLARKFHELNPGIHLAMENILAEADLSEVQKTVLFRVIQEALNNVGKHSGAHKARVVLRALRGEIELTVADDGGGFSLDGREREGVGLSSMQERLELIGGRLEIKTAPGRGCTVKALLPR